MITSSVRRAIEELMESRERAAIVKELLVYFGQNRKAAETPSQLATRIHRRREEVYPVLEALTRAAILKKKSTERGSHYLYRPDAEARVRIQEYLRTLPTKQRKLRTATERFRKEWGKKY